MKNNYFKLRVFLIMFALGLAAVPFSKFLSEKFSVVSVDLPQTASKSPLIIEAKYRNEVDYGGGSGPDGRPELEGTAVIINTLGSRSKPHIIENAELPKAALQNLDLNEAQIKSSNFSKANFTKTTFIGAIVFYSSFIESNFKNADLSNAKFFGSDFTDADLSGANLTSANLAHTDFSGALLTNADLTDANLSDARLESAKGLTFDQLSWALISKFTKLPAKFAAKRDFLVERSRQRLLELKKENRRRNWNY